MDGLKLLNIYNCSVSIQCWNNNNFTENLIASRAMIAGDWFLFYFCPQCSQKVYTFLKFYNSQSQAGWHSVRSGWPAVWTWRRATGSTSGSTSSFSMVYGLSFRLLWCTSRGWRCPELSSMTLWPASMTSATSSGHMPEPRSRQRKVGAGRSRIDCMPEWIRSISLSFFGEFIEC